MSRMLRRSGRHRAGGGGGGGINGFTGRLTFTIAAAQCGTADSTDFPVCVRETLAALKTTGNGGSVTNANGYDIVFCSDAGLTTPLDFEIEKYTASTGEYVAHVRIPTLSHTVDTVFYAGYGKASITTSQENITAVWDTNFKAVYHFKGAGGGFYTTPDPAAKDSTANANNFTVGPFGATSISATSTGQIAQGYGNSTSAPDSASLRPSTNFTIEAWIKPPNFSNYRAAVSKATNSTARRNYVLFTEITTGKAILSCSQGGTNRDCFGTSTLSTSAFSHVVGTYDGSNERIYVNGVLEGTLAVTGAMDTSASDFFTAGDYGVNQSFPFAGIVDEVRLSASVRSASWILAQYNNQKSSSTFYAVT